MRALAPPRLRPSLEKEMVQRLKKVMPMPERDKPSGRVGRERVVGELALVMKGCEIRLRGMTRGCSCCDVDV